MEIGNHTLLRDNKFIIILCFCSCSVIRNIVNTFDDMNLNTENYLPSNKSCYTLLVADCTSAPRMGVFINTASTKENIQYHLKIFIGENYFTFDPQARNNDELFITLNGKDKINIQSQAYQFPILEKFYDFRVEINEQNVLTIDNALMRTIIQFDLLNIINVEIYASNKDKMCGICSLPLNSILDNSYCWPN